MNHDHEHDNPPAAGAAGQAVGRVSARARIHAMFNLDEAGERELDVRLDAHRAEVLAADGQAYDGQLAMLTGLVATLNAVAEHGDLSEVRKVLAEYAIDDAAARSAAEGGAAGA